jgi:hypothetical protein
VSERWNNIAVLRRLHSVVAAVPAPEIGGSTKSSAIGGFVGFSEDMLVVQKLTDRVLVAVCCPAPDRDIGDDGYRDDRRTEALLALEWAEKWVAWRNAATWRAVRTEWLMTLP